MGKMRLAFAALGALLFSGVVFAAGMGVMVENPWIREAPPGAAAMAGYMVVHNSGKEARALVGASSSAFASAMLHKTIVENGMAKMVHQPKIEIPAGGQVTFQPDGYHIMLMKPKHPLKAGDKVPVTLKFANGESMQVTFEVRAAGAGMKGMDHGSMPGM